jgi:hypothetical protein
MKSVMSVRVLMGLGLLAIGGAHALAAAEAAVDGQEQARLLLSGRGASLSEFASASSSAPKAGAPDAQAQAREMILGRKSAKPLAVDANALLDASAAADRNAARNPQEMARRMILGSRSAGSKPTIRRSAKQGS